MNGPTFEQMSAPGTYMARGRDSWHWLDAECPLIYVDSCRIPELPGHVSEVPEPSGALLLACGLVAIYLWRRL